MKISDMLCLMQLYIMLIKSTVAAQEYHPPSPDFDRHNIVRPVLLHKRTKREITTTRDTGGLHHLEVILKVPVNGEEYTLDLRLNQDLVPDNHVLSYQENGNTVLHKPTKEDMDLCHYGGSVRGRPGSWVAVSTCHGVQGIVFDGKRMRYIEPAQGGDVNTDHYIYDHLNLMETHPRMWGTEVFKNTRHNSYEYHSNTTTKHKRQASNKASLKSHQPHDRSLYVELVLVADKKHFEENHRRNRHSVHREMRTLANIINSVYSQLNIFIVLVGVVIWDDRDEIYFKKDSMSILENFMKYRRTKLVKEIPNDNAHLITLRPFEGTVLGKAFIGKMCTLQSSGGIAHHHTKVTGLLAMTIAHEMGHNLGMEHDGDDCECPDWACIMSHTSTEHFTPSHWSSCSLNSLAYYFSKGIDNCLRNKPNSSYKYSKCGNGLVELGEQCDCGSKGSKGAQNHCHACCDPGTCRLRANAICAAGSCCDIQTCRPMPAGTLCRAAARECDLPEYCGGHSALCPDDVHKMDATPCGEGGESAYCVEGGCRSHSDQCRVLWGSTGKSCADQFYRHNTAGDRVEYATEVIKSTYRNRCLTFTLPDENVTLSDHNNSLLYRSGDCGYDSLQRRYKKCANPDVMCGRLHCEHLSESSRNINQLNIGIEYTIHNTAAKTPNRTATCYAVSIDLGLDVVDFGLVPDGAKCGKEMMCLKQRCVPVAAVRKRAEEIVRRREKIVTPPSPLKEETHPSPPKKETHPRPPKKETHPSPPKKETHPPPPKKKTHPSPPNSSSVCSSKCSGHGVCNSKGHCLCEPGFTPPFCAQPEPDGAHGFDPATETLRPESYKLVLYVIFLGIVPAILLVLLMVYCSRHNVLEGLKEYKQILRFKSKTTDSVSRITARKSSVIYANITAVQTSIGPVNSIVGQGTPMQDSNTAVQGSSTYTNTTNVKGWPIEASLAIVQESPIYSNTAEVCNSSTLPANLEENTSKKFQKWPKNPPTFPLQGTGKSAVKVVTEVRTPTPNFVNLSREIRPNDQKVNSVIKIRPLVKLKPILKNKSEEIRSNVHVAISEIKNRPLVKRPNLNNRTEEIGPNVRALKAKLESKNQTSG